MLRYLIVFIIVTLISFSLYMAQYLGAFKTVEIRNQESGPFVMVYLDHMGPYHKIVAKIEEVEKWAKTNQFDCHLSFGEYLDNPDVVEEARLKSRGGCILEVQLSEDPALVEKKWAALLQPPLKIKTVPRMNYVRAEFLGSPGIGPLKVYPKVDAFIKERNLKRQSSIIEIYEILDHSAKNQMRTIYLF